MRNNTKIMLSARELAIVTEADFILTKQKIIHQVFEMFQQQVPLIQLHFKSIWRQLEIVDRLPNISKGEQYRQLPYAVMDYPAVFDKQHRMALRTIFCWADAFSITIQLSGKYKELLLNSILTGLQHSAQTPFYIGVNVNEWEHHFEPDNYLPLQQFTASSLEAKLHLLPHIKIALRYPLAQWNNMNQHFKEGYAAIAALIDGSNQLPIR